MFDFSVIGTPAGFEILSAGDVEKLSLPSKVDLKNSAINVFPETDILMGYREVINDSNYIYLVYYRFANEIDVTRPGSYYGSVIVLGDVIGKPSFAWQALVDLANIVQENCLTDGRFHRDIKTLQFETPDSVDLLWKHLVDFKSVHLKSPSELGFLLVGDEIKSYEHFLELFLNDKRLATFQTLYASRSRRVLQYVEERRQLRILKISEMRQAEDDIQRVTTSSEARQDALPKNISQISDRDLFSEVMARLTKENGRSEVMTRLTKESTQLKNDTAQLRNDNARLKNDNAQLKNENARLRAKSASGESHGTISISFPSFTQTTRRILLGLGALILLLSLIFSFWNPFSQSNSFSTSDKTPSLDKKKSSDPIGSTATSPIKPEDLSVVEYEYDGKILKLVTLNGLMTTVLGHCGSRDAAKARFLASLRTMNSGIQIDEHDLSKTNISGIRIRFELPEDCQIAKEHFTPINSRANSPNK